MCSRYVHLISESPLTLTGLDYYEEAASVGENIVLVMCSRYIHLISDPPLTHTGLDYHEEAARVGEHKVFDCDVCSHPGVDTYTWYHNGTQISDKQQINITNIDEFDYGNYSAVVCSTINDTKWCNQFIYDLKAKG